MLILIGIMLFNGAFNYWVLKNSSSEFSPTRLFILGDSFTESSVDPSKFESARNLSQGAENAFISFIKLKKITESHVPDTILLGFTHHSIAYFNDLKFIDETWSGEMMKRLFPLKGIGGKDYIFEFDKKKYWKTCFRRMLLLPNPSLHKAYEGSFNPSARNELKYLNKTIERHYMNDEISEVSVMYFDSIIQLCSDLNIDLVLIATPVHNDYYNRIPQKIKSRYSLLQNQYRQNGVLVLDYSNMEIEDQKFKNFDHLNALGAEEFSLRLVKDLKSYSP